MKTLLCLTLAACCAPAFAADETAAVPQVPRTIAPMAGSAMASPVVGGVAPINGVPTETPAAAIPSLPSPAINAAASPTPAPSASAAPVPAASLPTSAQAGGQTVGVSQDTKAVPFKVLTSVENQALADHDDASALRQARRELEQLKQQLNVADTASRSQRVAASMGHEYSGGGAEARAANAEAASGIQTKIEAKRAQIDQIREKERARYEGLRAEIKKLKHQRDGALATARAMRSSGGATNQESAGRSEEAASALSAQIKDKQHEVALILRDNPGFAKAAAPFVWAKNKIPLFTPRSAAEEKLRADIAALKRQRKDDVKKRDQSWQAARDGHVSGNDGAAKMNEEIRSIDAQLADKQKQLEALR